MGGEKKEKMRLVCGGFFVVGWFVIVFFPTALNF